MTPFDISGECTICSNETTEILTLENFPRGAVFYPSSDFVDYEDGETLVLTQCKSCKHLQLNNHYQSCFYDSDYSFSTNPQHLKIADHQNKSVEKLEDLINSKSAEAILEIGANDLSFLNTIKFPGSKIAVDPILKSVDASSLGIEVFSQLVEDLDDELFERCDIFVSRHNLEHLKNPGELIRRVESASARSKRQKHFFVEVPDLDMLIMNSRMDNIFLEHLHYFNQESLKHLFEVNGFDCIETWKNQRYGGSVCGIFTTRGKALASGRVQNVFTDKEGELLVSFDKFKVRCGFLREFMEKNFGNCYGYGAGHSTPFLAYHIDGRYHHFEGIFDDAPNKQGKKIRGIAAPVISPEHLQAGHSIVVTATDYTEQIVKKIGRNYNVVGFKV